MYVNKSEVVDGISRWTSAVHVLRSSLSDLLALLILLIDSKRDFDQGTAPSYRRGECGRVRVRRLLAVRILTGRLPVLSLHELLSLRRCALQSAKGRRASFNA